MPPRPLVIRGDACALPLADASVDAIVCDPPYGLGFMGKEWDTPGAFVERRPARRNTFDHVGGNHNPVNSADAARTRRVESVKFGAWCATWAAEAYRVLKPGGHLLAFGGTRTWHRLVCAVEDAGFEIRDTIMWLYGSGFPKSLDVGKAIGGQAKRATPATEAAARWSGWGTALKPGWEPIVAARKPLAGTVAANVLEHGTGALNIDACRVDAVPRNPGFKSLGERSAMVYGVMDRVDYQGSSGRWPANVVLSHSIDCPDDTCTLGCPVGELDLQTGHLGAGGALTGSEPSWQAGQNGIYGMMERSGRSWQPYGDDGGASRFYPVFRYEPKASRRERPVVDGVAHPTVKPLGLMRWLVRLVTPPGGLVLDMFAGSGTTLEAAAAEGFRVVGVEREAAYLPLIRARLNRATPTPRAVRPRRAGREPQPTLW